MKTQLLNRFVNIVVKGEIGHYHQFPPLSQLYKQEGHDGPGSLTLIIKCTAMQNTSRQLF